MLTPVINRSQLRKSKKTRKLGSWDHDGITMGMVRYNPTTVSEFLTLVGLGPAWGPFFIQVQLPATFFSLDESPKVQTCCRRSEINRVRLQPFTSQVNAHTFS